MDGLMFPKPPKKKKGNSNTIPDSKRKTLTNGRCFLTNNPYDLHKHEIFGGKNRQDSIRYGMVIELTGAMHNIDSEGCHQNPALDLIIKRWGQKKFEELHPDEDFVKIFGMNYFYKRLEEKLHGELATLLEEKGISVSDLVSEEENERLWGQPHRACETNSANGSGKNQAAGQRNESEADWSIYED